MTEPMTNRLAINESKPANYSSGDKTFAFVMLFCGFLYWNLIKPISFGAGVSIFTVVLLIVIVFYLKESGVLRTKTSALWSATIFLSGLSFTIFDNWTLKALNFIFISVMFLYWVSVSTNTRIDGKLSVYIVGDMLNQIFIVPFSNFICCLGAVKSGTNGSRQWRGLMGAVIGIVVFLPVLILVTSLLIDADAAFESITEKFRFSISEDLLEYILQVILGIPVACYLYGSVYGNRYGRHVERITKGTIDKTTKRAHFAPRITVYSAMTTLNIIYTVFFIAGASYLFSAFANDLPGPMSFAEYARRGFFELCAVAAINLCVIVVATIITARENEDPNKTPDKAPDAAPKVLRIQIMALCVFTMMLILTALRKMVLYINYYGLTQLRVFTTWFMLILFVIFIIVAIRQTKIFNSARVIAITLIAGLLLLTYSNVDGNIAKYNIERFREGTLRTIDVDALSELSAGAAPYIYELYRETKDEDLKKELVAALIFVNEEGDEYSSYQETFRDFNLQKFKAEKIRKSVTQVEETFLQPK